ncbi:hypothetical protein BTO05_07640 [Winogradskyella sp. PC-19]|uniref:hypothetical protein n=1 Tax=unclassified Winogradskyella TaxID=2615021 RepID=UPI000B3CF1A0|nr:MULTISPECIES: hypothetical protein [unclassified Winogradskyella]ARV09518.1 hypothetical protein BTO05_07640 [Winogradskyella sp. PC-19]
MEFVLSHGLSILPFLITILFLSKSSYHKGDKSYQIFCIYITFIALIEIVSGIMNYNGIYNLFFSHVYFYGEFLFLSLFFRQLIEKSQKTKASLLIIIFASILVFLIILSASGYFVLSPFHPIEVLVCGLPILALAIVHLYNSLSKSLKYVYITIGVIVYKTVSVLVFTLQNFANNIDSFDNLSNILLGLNSVFLYIYYGLIIFEWFKSFRQKKVS